MKANQDIRNAVSQNGFHLWELAEALEMTDVTLSKKMRRELPEVQKAHVFKTIERMNERRYEQGVK